MRKLLYDLAQLTGRTYTRPMNIDEITLHAHVDTMAADCDGPVSDSYVSTFNDDEIAEHVAAQGINDFSDIHFMNRVFTNLCGPYAVHQMRVTVDDDGFEWTEQTEEGHRSGQVRWCHDDCNSDERSHRDYFAEAMGY